MNPATKRQFVIWNGGAFVLGLLPIVLFWFFFLRTPSVDVYEAKRILSETNSTAILVDVRSPESLASRAAKGSVNLPLEKLRALSILNDLPVELKGKKLLLICDTGLNSARAVEKLRSIGVSDALNVSGGLEAWFASGDGKTTELPFRPMSRIQQVLPVFIAFVLKPIYMVMSLVLIIWIWRQPALDLSLLRWGLIWFWIGENGCSIDFLFYERGSDFWEYVHGFGMAAGFSMVALALLEGIDHRVIKFSPEKERCAALNLCRKCFKYVEAPCALKRIFQVMIPAFALLSLMPLCASLNLTAYNTNIFGTKHTYCHMLSSQLFEWRLCPIIALLFFVASWLVLMFKRTEPVATSKLLFAAGLGPFSFGLLRLFFVSTYTDNLMWFDVWEEVTEFLFVFGTGVVLWVFRDTLFTKKAPAVSAQATLGVPA